MSKTSLLLVALLLTFSLKVSAESGGKGSAGVPDSVGATGYGYGYEDYNRTDNSNLFLGESAGSGQSINVYPLDRNTFLNEVPEPVARPEDSGTTSFYESSVNSYLGEKISPQDDPGRVLESYQNLQDGFWSDRGQRRLEHVR